MPRRSLLLSLAVALAVCAPARAAVPDPTVMGPQGYDQITYDAGATIVSDPQGLTYPQELTGSMWIPHTAGPLPVILLLHGHHATCAYAGVEAIGSPCPDTAATRDVRSYEGYDYLARNLASHGYLTLSLDANGINTYDQVGDNGGNERAQLLARTLDLLAAWNTGPGPGEVGGRLVDRVDLSRIGLMGHSRGGGGVTNFVGYNATRTDGPRYPGLKAVFDLAGTDYQTPTVKDVNLGVLLPLCDGDVYDLQSAFTFDRSRFADPKEPGVRVQYVVRGADHDFFNTVWTNDDYTGTDPSCDPASTTTTRLSPAAQRHVGLALMAAFLRRYVGPEPAFQPLMTGAARRSGVQTSYLPPAAERRLVVTPRPDAHPLTETDDGAPVTESGLSAWSFCDPHADSGSDGGNRDPGTNSGCPTNPDRSRARQLTAAWDGPAVVRAAVTGDVSRFAALTFRVGVNFADAKRNPPGRRPVFDVVLEDSHGHRASVRAGDYSNAFDPPPGGADRRLTLNGVRIPLSAFAGCDLRHLAAVELRMGTKAAPTGSVQLAELGFGD